MDNIKPWNCLICNGVNNLLNLGSTELQFCSEFRTVIRKITGIVIQPCKDPKDSCVCTDCIRQAIDGYECRQDTIKGKLDSKEQQENINMKNITQHEQPECGLDKEDDDVKFVSITIDIAKDNRYFITPKFEVTDMSVDELINIYMTNSEECTDNKNNASLQNDNFNNKNSNFQTNQFNCSKSESELDEKDQTFLDEDKKLIEEKKTEVPATRRQHNIQKLLKKYPNIKLPEMILENGLKNCFVKLSHQPIKNYIRKVSRRMRRLTRRRLATVTDSPKRKELPDTLPTAIKDLESVFFSSLGLSKIKSPSPFKTPIKSNTTRRKVPFKENAYGTSTTPKSVNSSSTLFGTSTEPLSELPLPNNNSRLQIPIKNSNSWKDDENSSLTKIIGEEKIYLCVDCSRVCENIQALISHRKSHTRCVLCRQRFQSSAEVRKHIRTNCPKSIKRVSICLTKMEDDEEIRQFIPSVFFQALGGSMINSSESANSNNSTDLNSSLKSNSFKLYDYNNFEKFANLSNRASDSTSDATKDNDEILKFESEVSPNLSCINLIEDLENHENEGDIKMDFEISYEKEYSEDKQIVDEKDIVEILQIDNKKVPIPIKTYPQMSQQKRQAQYLEELLQTTEKEIDASFSLRKSQVSPDSSVSIKYSNNGISIQNLMPCLVANEEISIDLEDSQNNSILVDISSYSSPIGSPKISEL